MARAAIVDTNVVVSGLLTGNAASPVARILDGMLAGAFPFVVSEALLGEYRAVLVRPALRKVHGLSVAQIDVLLTDLAQHAIVLEPASSAPSAPDAGDQLLWNLLATRDDLLLVTGDKALQRDAAMRARVLTPQAFLEG